MNGFCDVFVTVLRLFMKVFKHLKQSHRMSVVMTVACLFTYLYSWNLHSFYLKKISSINVLLWCQNMPSLSPNIEWFVNKKVENVCDMFWMDIINIYTQISFHWPTYEYFFIFIRTIVETEKVRKFWIF